MQANLVFNNEEPLIRLKAFFWQKEINLLEINSQKKTKPKRKKEKKKKRKFNFWKKHKPLLKAIQVKQFYLNIDTDDYIWNAYLYPISNLLSNQKRQLKINFQGDFEILLEVQSRPIQILYALLR